MKLVLALTETMTGICKPWQLARKMGVSLPLDEVKPSYVLGVTDTSPLELAGAYDWHFDYLSHWAAAMTGPSADPDATRTAIRDTAGRVLAAARPLLTHLRERSVGFPDPLIAGRDPQPAPVVVATVTP